MSVMSIPRIFPLQRHGFFMAAALEVEVARWILEVLHSEQESLTHYQQSDVRFFPSTPSGGNGIFRGTITAPITAVQLHTVYNYPTTGLSLIS